MDNDLISGDGTGGGGVWSMRMGPDTVYGKLTLAALVSWAEQGRIVPGCEISRNNRDWVQAETVPELKMDWLVGLKSGAQYGPVNLLAIPGLLRRGMVDPTALLENKMTGRKMARPSLLREVVGVSTTSPTAPPPQTPTEPPATAVESKSTVSSAPDPASRDVERPTDGSGSPQGTSAEAG